MKSMDRDTGNSKEGSHSSPVIEDLDEALRACDLGEFRQDLLHVEMNDFERTGGSWKNQSNEQLRHQQILKENSKIDLSEHSLFQRSNDKISTLLCGR